MGGPVFLGRFVPPAMRELLNEPSSATKKEDQMNSARPFGLLTCLGAVLVAVPAIAADFYESEDNNNKMQANAFGGLVAGDRILGVTTGALVYPNSGLATADYFRLSLAGLNSGIYRHRLVIDSNTPGHTGSIRGLTQTNGVINASTDALLQQSSASTNPSRFNQWYGFGKGESLYYRVAGQSSTTDEYRVRLETVAVTPMNLGSYMAGQIVISTMNQNHSTDTDLWVYDSSFNALPGFGNDKNSILGGGTGVGDQSRLARTYAPGRYYVALSTSNLANSLASPADDDYRSGAITDFPDMILNGGTDAGLRLTFSISGLNDSNTFSAHKGAPYDVFFGTFNVVPEPASMAALGLGVAALLRRKRK